MYVFDNSMRWLVKGCCESLPQKYAMMVDTAEWFLECKDLHMCSTCIRVCIYVYTNTTAAAAIRGPQPEIVHL